MSNVHSNTSNHSVQSSADNARLDEVTTEYADEAPRAKRTTPIEILQIQANEHRRVSLGEYSKYRPVRGFSIEVDPDPTPVGSVHTEIRSSGTDALYELILHVTNLGTKTITAKVWEL